MNFAKMIGMRKIYLPAATAGFYTTLNEFLL